MKFFNAALNILSIICILFIANLFLRTYVFKDYKIEGDYIIHKKYGKYPKEVPFKKGMTLYPQQSARIEIKNIELGKIYEIDENGKQKEVAV